MPIKGFALTKRRLQSQIVKKLRVYDDNSLAFEVYFDMGEKWIDPEHGIRLPNPKPEQLLREGYEIVYPIDIKDNRAIMNMNKKAIKEMEARIKAEYPARRQFVERQKAWYEQVYGSEGSESIMECLDENYLVKEPKDPRERYKELTQLAAILEKIAADRKSDNKPGFDLQAWKWPIVGGVLGLIALFVLFK